MKNIIWSILSVTFVVMIAVLFMEKTNKHETMVEPTISEYKNVKAFQIGAFRNQDSAIAEATANDGIVIQEGELYLVVISLLEDADNIQQMIQYLNNNNMYYYIKNLNMKTTYEITTLENMMHSTTSDIAYLRLNKQILNKYKEENYAN